MKYTYSRIVGALVLGGTLGFAADAGNLEEALSQGTLSANIGVYGQYSNNQGGTKDSGFSNGFTEIGFETAPLYGVSLGVRGFGSAKIGEKEDGDYKGEGAIEDNAVLSEAFIKIEHEGMGKVVLGRQAVDFNWLTDYIEGASVEVSALENLVVTMAWARKYAVVGFDEVSEEFGKINENDGLYMLEVKYTPIEALELNPYVYYGENLFGAYGMKATLSLEPSDALKTTTMLHYAKINSDALIEEDDGSGSMVEVNVKDGSFMQAEQGFEFAGALVALGYVKIDKDGLGGLGEVGDQMPLEDGNHILDADAKTPYIRAEYEIEGVKLGALYAQTKYDDAGLSLKEKELDISVGYEIVKNLEASLIYVNVDNDVKADSYNAFKALVQYAF